MYIASKKNAFGARLPEKTQRTHYLGEKCKKKRLTAVDANSQVNPVTGVEIKVQGPRTCKLETDTCQKKKGLGKVAVGQPLLAHVAASLIAPR